MTDKQFEKIKKGLNFHSEGGIDNLCTLTETTLRAILDDATKELEAQNTELKCECRSCVYSDTPCILSDYGKDRNGICDHFKDVFDELTLTNNECKDMREELKQRIRENQKLCEQIEKMKNCANCKNYNDNEGFCVLGSGYGYNCNLDKWEIKEK